MTHVGGAGSEPPKATPEPSLERTSFEDHRNALKFEHDLIDRKLARLLTSQTILFAAVSLAASRADAGFIKILALTGLALCVVTAIGMAGNFRAKRYVFTDYRKMVESSKWRHTPPELPVQWGVRTVTTWWGLVADLLFRLCLRAHGWRS